jgi:acyl-CoA thioesterase
MGSEFDADTQVEATGPGEYAGAVTDRWHALAGPNGGYLLAMCLQALREEMPHPDPLVVSAYYLRPAQVGAATLRTESVRVGRRTSTGHVAMVQEGRERMRALATFGDSARSDRSDRSDGRRLLLDDPPVLPPPQECHDFVRAAIQHVSIADRIDYRFARLPGWMHGEPGGKQRMEFWMRLRDGREPDLLTLPLMVDAAPPVVLDFGVTDSATVELTVHLRARPAPGWLACRVTTSAVLNGLHDEDFAIWDSAGTLVAQSRQLAVLP